MPHTSSTMLRRFMIGGLITAFLVLDYFVPLAWDFDAPWWAFTAAGVCIGQLNLLAIWAAFTPGNVMVRLPWSFLLAVLMWYAIVLGCGRSNVQELQGVGSITIVRGISREDSFVLGTFLLSGVVVLQVPLWIAAKAFRWRLGSWQAESDHSEAQRSQFHLHHLMLATLLCAVALALGRVVLPPGEGDWPFVADDVQMLIVLAVLVVSNLLITLPAIWGTFAQADRLFILAILWLLCCTAVTVGEFAVLEAIHENGEDTVEHFLCAYVANLSQWLTVSGVLLILRVLGFRLQRSPRTARSLEPIS